MTHKEKLSRLGELISVQTWNVDPEEEGIWLWLIGEFESWEETAQFLLSKGWEP